MSYDELSTQEYSGETSAEIRSRVALARKIQEDRFSLTPGIFCNAQMPSRMVRELCQLDAASTNLLKTAMNKLQLSARAYDRILKVARTCADLVQCEDIKMEYLAEAIQYRSLDREGWAG